MKVIDQGMNVNDDNNNNNCRALLVRQCTNLH